MRLSFSLLFAVAASTAVAKNAWDSWSKEKSERWLEDHGVPNPGNLNTQQLHKLVADNYDSAYTTFSDLQIREFFIRHGLLPPSASPTPSSWFARVTDGVADTASDASSAAEEQRSRMERAIRRTYDDSYEAWDDSSLKEWLEDHGILTPPKSTHEQLVETVGSYWDAAQSHLSSVRSQPSTTDRAKQQFFNAYNMVPSSDDVQNKLLATWSDSQLRDYLLERGVVSPSGKREELELAVKQRLAIEQQRLDRVREGATETISTAWYSATEAPKVAYDWTVSSINDANDYVWSTWTDSDLRSYLEEYGVVKPKAQLKREELLESIRAPFSDAATHTYNTWSDSYLRTWLVNHGVVRGKTATTRDELLDLVSRNYYGARDTTFHLWSDNQIRRWLQSRGLIKSDAQKTRDELIEMMEENYYSLRDSAWQTWDDSMARDWLHQRGYIKTPYEAKRDEIVDLLQSYYHTAQDSVWDAWTDAQERAWLVQEGVLDAGAAANKKRGELEDLIAENWARSTDHLSHSWSESDMKQWLVENGYIKSDAEKKKDEIVDLFRSNYKNLSKKTTEYTSWSDNRLRAWLREHGVNVSMNSQRAELLQQMKENYVATTGTLAGVFETVQDYVEGGIKNVKDMLGQNKIDREVAAAEKSAEAALKSASSAAASAKASADKAREEL